MHRNAKVARIAGRPTVIRGFADVVSGMGIDGNAVLLLGGLVGCRSHSVCPLAEIIAQLYFLSQVPEAEFEHSKVFLSD